jgi:hypothetical protein
MAGTSPAMTTGIAYFTWNRRLGASPATVNHIVVFKFYNVDISK